MCVGRMLVPETTFKKEYFYYYKGFKVTEPYQMLNYIAISEIDYVKADILCLQNVLNGELESYKEWGMNEMVLIDSYKEKSIIRYDLLFSPLGDKNIEVPTIELLALMQDWALFLESNQIDRYEKLHYSN
jgi:hypothetical protein